MKAMIPALFIALLLVACAAVPDSPDAGVPDALGTGCTEDARLCPDGSTVVRDPALDCDFPACPTSAPGIFASFCTDDVVEVYDCGAYIKAVHGLLGGGVTWFQDGESFRCPVVGPDSMSPQCKAIFESEPSCVLATTCDFKGPSGGQEQVPDDDLTLCDPKDRPEICTMIYAPVCGKKEVPVQCIRAPCPPITAWMTYGSACTACADPDVTGYVEGEC